MMISSALKPPAPSRTRNAQAQADLRARRKAHVSRLEADNSALRGERESLLAETRRLREHLAILKSSAKGTSEDQARIDVLIAAVDKEKQKSDRLRDAVRQLIAVANADLEVDDPSVLSSGSLRKRSRASSDASSCTSATAKGSHTEWPDTPSLATSSTASSSRSSAESMGRLWIDSAATHSSPSKDNLGPSEDWLSAWFVSQPTPMTQVAGSVTSVPPPTCPAITSTSISAHADRTHSSGLASQDEHGDILSLLLAQPASFKREAARALGIEFGNTEQVVSRSRPYLSGPETSHTHIAPKISPASIFLLFRQKMRRKLT